MLPRNGLLQIALTTAVFLVLWFAVRFVLFGNTQPGHRELRQAANQIVNAEQVRKAATTAVESAKASAHAAEGDVAAALSRAASAHARARVTSAGDIIVAATPNAAEFEVRAPALVVERMRLDSSAVDALGALVQRKDAVIVAQDRRFTADSIELVATSNAFHALERVKEPRCGRRCGIVLGVGGMLAAAIAVEQVRRAFR